jgi:hypothetical protein
MLLMMVISGVVVNKRIIYLNDDSNDGMVV